MKVLIIGAGGFGKYHTYSLSQYENEIYIVDPSKIALDSLDVLSNPNLKKIESLNQIKKGEAFDFCIIATSADIRIEQLVKVKEMFSVDKYLLEKVVINNIEDYDKLTQLETSNIYVNYARRVYPFYMLLKKKLSKFDEIEILMDGGNNNLLCNAMHYIDLYEYLTGSVITDVDSCLYGARESKRNGYVDANGVIVAKNEKGLIVLNNNRLENPNTFTIKSNGKILIEYVERDGVIFDDLNLNWSSEIVVEQSKLTQRILENNLDKCAKLDEVLSTNKKFIVTLLQSELFKDMKRVPIT